MKKIQAIWFIWLLIVFINLPVFSQDSYQSKYSVSFFSGITIPIGNLREGSIGEIFSKNSFNNGYALSNIGYSISVYMGYSFTNNFRLNIGIQGSFFSGDSSISSFGGLTSDNQKAALKGQIISLKTVLSYCFANIKRTNVSASLAPQVNIINGHSEFRGQKQGKIESAFRLGMSCGLICNYKINQRYFIGFPVEYHVVNIIGKDFTEDHSNNIYINDGDSPDNLIKSKSINYISIMFQFGISIK